MGAAGAALAGSIGQGLQARALMQQQGQTQIGQPGQAGVISPQDITTLMRLAGLEVPSGVSFSGPIQTTAFNTAFPYIASSQRPPETGTPSATVEPYATATPRMLEAGLPERLDPAQFLDAYKIFHPQDQETADPFMVTPPDPVAELFGLQRGQPIPAANLSQVGTIAEDLANAGILPQPKPEPLFYYTVQTDDPSRYGQLIDYFPNLKPGQRIPQNEAEAMLSFAERLQKLEGDAADTQKKLYEVKRLDYQWRNSLVPVNQASEILQGQGIANPVIRDVDGDGKVLWEDLLKDNTDMAELVRTARDIDRIVEVTRGIVIDNAIKDIERSFTPQLMELSIQQLSANTQIDEARASQIVEELRLGREKTKGEIDRIRQEVEQGATMFEANMELMQERIRELREKNKITENEAVALEQEAALESLLLEYQVARLQQEVSPIAAESLWITLGLDGEHSPSGIKLYRGNVEPMISFLEANSGKVVTAKDMLVAAGIDLDLVPKEALEEPIAVDEFVVDAVRTVTGVGVEEEDVTEPLDLIIKLANLFSPYLSSNVNAQILAASLGRANPEMVASLLASPYSTFVEEMEKILPGSSEHIERIILNAAERAVGSLVTSGSTVDFSPEVMGWAMQVVSKAGDPQTAYQVVANNREMLLNDPESFVYQNPMAYQQLLSALQYMAGGGE